MTPKPSRCIIGSLMVLLMFCSIFLPVVTAQDEPLLAIEIYDDATFEELETDSVIQGKSYDIIVVDNDVNFVVNVSVALPWATLVLTNETPYINITAPSMDEYPSFTITASKEGYLPAIRTISVLKGDLTLSIDHDTVDEGSVFQVTVRDQDGYPVDGALVFIDTGAPVMTNLQGIAFVDSPKVDKNEEFTVQASKDGYTDCFGTIQVQDTGGSILTLGDNMLVEIAPILFAAAAVIFAVFYVRWRRKHQRDLPSVEPTAHDDDGGFPEAPSVNLRNRKWENEPASYHVSEHKSAPVSSPDPRVEEIRIPLQEKRKETTFLPSNTHDDSSSDSQTDKESEWFKGQEYIRYKIDEMTGKIDQKGEGKWFEGERDIQSKVDEALKKQPRKKKMGQSDNK